VTGFQPPDRPIPGDLGLTGTHTEDDQGVRMFPGGGDGAPNLQDLAKLAQQMQSDYLSAQQELVEAEVSASAGGGLVTATVTGSGELKSIKIDPKAVDPSDVESLEDLVTAAIHAANDEAKKLAEAKLGPITQMMGGMGGGLGLPGM
jgi:DNA-binding YbaB/EbfC family protein